MNCFESLKNFSPMQKIIPRSSDTQDKFYSKPPRNHFIERYVSIRGIGTPDLLEDLVKPGDSNFHIFQSILRTENERAVETFQRLGAEILRPQGNDMSCISILVRWGYASLLRSIGLHAASTNGKWLEKMEKLPLHVGTPSSVTPLLLIACERGLPNLDVIKILIGEFGANPNCCVEKEKQTPLHKLASADHWWHVSALESLIDRGADMEMKDSSGSTPLHIAVAHRSEFSASEILLRKGANPNVTDGKGLSCLNRASSNPEIVRLLLQYGADVSAGKTPFIFSAIEVMDLDTINLLVEYGANLNVRPEPKKEPEGGLKRSHSQGLAYRMWKSRDVAEESYPVHYAAHRNNTPEWKGKMILIIEALLSGGADPTLAVQ